MNRILLPVELPHAEPRVVQQAAFLARHFHSEILLLHVVTPFSYPAGVLESGHEIMAKDLHAEIIKRAQNDLDQSLRSDSMGLPSDACCSKVIQPVKSCRQLVAKKWI